MYIAFIRWFIFLTIGLPLQIFVIMPIYVLIYLFWHLWYFKSINKRMPQYEFIPVMPIYHYEYGILINNDDHGAFTQYTDCTASGLLQFVDYPSNEDRHLTFLRTPKYNKADNRMYNEVSGDTVISFCFAAVLPDPQTHQQRMYDPAVKKAILELAKSYLIFLGTRSFDKKNNGHVSARCSNFGVNWCPDGWGQLSQPMFGPNFYTSSALFALAANFSRFWKVVFWVHWWVLGGWFWAFMPAMYPRNGLWYTRDMLMKALFVHRIIFGDRWWIKLPMQITNDSVLGHNALFEAMMKGVVDPYLKSPQAPPSIEVFFSQNAYGDSLASRLDGDRVLPTQNLVKTLQWIATYKV